jgi:hypothetical protein
MYLNMLTEDSDHFINSHIPRHLENFLHIFRRKAGPAKFSRKPVIDLANLAAGNGLGPDIGCHCVVSYANSLTPDGEFAIAEKGLGIKPFSAVANWSQRTSYCFM